MHYIASSLTRYGFQCAFALAPLPAYLPQYWALCKSSQDPILQSKVPKQLGVGIKRQGSSNCISFAESGDLSCSIPVSTNMQLNSGMSPLASPKSPTSPVVEGFSPFAILMLLLSHTLRLLYCCGAVIVVPLTKDGSDNTRGTLVDVRVDIVMQSMIMIGVQLFLLSAVTRSRRSAFKKAIPTSPQNSTRLNHVITTNTPPNEKYFFDKQRSPHISQKPFRWLNRPSQYWNWHSLRQHIEFLLLLTISTFGFCRLYLYPHDAIQCFVTFRNISVFLESCLALPQLMLNYKRKDTTGLSLVMVFGWFTGDLMKMGYFLLGNTVSAVFILCSVLAMGIDLVVIIQITFWFPTWEVQEMRNRVWYWKKGRKEKSAMTLSGESWQ